MRRKQCLKHPSTSYSLFRSEEEADNRLKPEMASVDSENSKSSLVCHLCLCKSENSQPLFEDSSQTVLESIRTVFQIEPIRDDAVPDQICSHCIEKIDEFIAFRQMVVENHQNLQLKVEGVKKVVVFEPCIKLEENKIEEKRDRKVVEMRSKRLTERIRRKPTKPPPQAPKLSSAAADRDDDHDILLRNFFTFVCSQCSQTFPRFHALRQHTISEHKQKELSIKCYQSDCNTFFRQRYKLIEHLKKHGAVPAVSVLKYRCNYCQKGFEHRSVLKFHLKRDNCKPFSNGIFECHYCSGFYYQKGPLKRHFQLNHGFKIFARNTKHECKKCKKSYVSENGLLRHIRVIHDRAEEVVCDLCAKVFAEKTGFQFHYKNVHASIPKVTCPLCGKKLRTKSVLCTHMRRTHQKQPMSCEICSKVLRNRESLALHIRDIHEAPKFKCPECEKSFRRKGKLVEHMTTHGVSGDLYKCEFCDKKFNFSSSKSLHKKTQHPVEWLQSRDETYNWTKKIQQQTNQKLPDGSQVENN